MAAGKMNFQAADGAVIGLVIPNGLTSGERQIALGVNLSGATAYHLLQGNLAVSNSTIKQGFNTTLYTSGSATTGIDMDTQWGNTVEERFGGLVWLKDRAEATNNFWYDTIRGATKEINSNTTEAEATLAGGLTAFNSTGFTVGADAGHNSTTNNMASWNFQTTHRVTGTTNHGKPYTCHYNPFTGFTMVKFEGSGIAGHEIPHHLGRKLGFATVKLLAGVNDWVAQYRDNNYLYLNTAAAEVSNSTVMSFNADSTVLNGATGNGTGSWIMYGWANSYYDEADKLIGNYELVRYQGTGATGNKVKTKGKPAWVMIKRTDVAGYWAVYDNQRTPDKYLLVNMTDQESNTQALGTFDSNGFTIKNTVWSDINAAGGQYIALVAYDTNSNGGGSYYPLASDTANVQINNALIPLAQGIDSNGAKNSILSKNETITGVTYTQGKNYVYCDKNGSYGVTPYKPRYLESELVRTYAGEAPEYYDVAKNKWFSTSGNGELVTNGTFDSNTTGWTPLNSTLSVVNNTLRVTTTSNYGGAYQTFTNLVVGKTYRYKLTGSLITSNQFLIRVGVPPFTSYDYQSTWQTISGSVYIDFISLYTTMAIEFIFGSTTGVTGSIDNVTCFASDIVPTTEITNSRNYLNHIVHADNDGGVLYVEELPKTQYFDRIETGNNRKVMYLADYGIAQIQNNKRYVLDNPFGNDRYMDCDTKLEVYDSGISKWIEVGHSVPDNGTGGAFYGAKSFSTLDGLIVQTAASSILYAGANGLVQPYASSSLTSAPARVTIQFNGRTGRTI